MRRILGLMVTMAAVGCHTSEKKDLRSPHVEEFNPPPDEARYNHPPEDKYRKRHELKDQARPGAGQIVPGDGPAMPPGGNGFR
jgi:hypothetical protein